MTASIKAIDIAKAMYRDGKHKTLLPRWYALTKPQALSELEAIVRNDRLSIPDYPFRTKYAAYIK